MDCRKEPGGPGGHTAECKPALYPCKKKAYCILGCIR